MFTSQILWLGRASGAWGLPGRKVGFSFSACSSAFESAGCIVTDWNFLNTLSNRNLEGHPDGSHVIFPVAHVLFLEATFLESTYSWPMGQVLVEAVDHEPVQQSPVGESSILDLMEPSRSKTRSLILIMDVPWKPEPPTGHFEVGCVIWFYPLWLPKGPRIPQPCNLWTSPSIQTLSKAASGVGLMCGAKIISTVVDTGRPFDPSKWTVVCVLVCHWQKFLQGQTNDWAKTIISGDQAELLRSHRIDGEALLMLDLSDIQQCGLLAEPAKKLESAIEDLKVPSNYLQTIIPAV